METEITSIAAWICDTEQRLAREGKDAALSGIRGVRNYVPWDEDIVRVVSSKKEEADQAFRIISGGYALGGQGGVEEPECPECGEDTGHPETCAGGLTNKFAACACVF